MNKHKFYHINQSPFYKLSSKRRLAELLFLSVKDLTLLTKHGLQYEEWDVMKRNGKGVRHIENPVPSLKSIQRRLAKKLSNMAPPDHLFCPVKQRSFIHNAKMHATSNVVCTLDIKDYFPSTSSRRVYWFWHKRMLCAPNIAGLLTAITCLNGHLPTGSPLSPIMSFYAHMDIWENIARIAKEFGCIVTVYIDDITISGAKVPENLLWQIKQEIKKVGLHYHKEKKFAKGWSEVTSIICRQGTMMAPNRTLKKVHELRKAVQSETNILERKNLTEKLRGFQTHLAQIRCKSLDLI